MRSVFRKLKRFQRLLRRASGVRHWFEEAVLQSHCQKPKLKLKRRQRQETRGKLNCGVTGRDSRIPKNQRLHN